MGGSSTQFLRLNYLYRSILPFRRYINLNRMKPPETVAQVLINFRQWPVRQICVNPKQPSELPRCAALLGVCPFPMQFVSAHAVNR
jgi:hypothetical protein